MNFLDLLPILPDGAWPVAAEAVVIFGFVIFLATVIVTFVHERRSKP